MKRSTAGAALPAAEYQLALAQVQHLCAVGVGTTITFDQYIDAVESSESLTDEDANVVARINNKPGLMGLSAHANSILLDWRTRGNDFCLVPGTRWEAVADLYANGSLRQSDAAAAVAL
jgi:hypothetical protein